MLKRWIARIILAGFKEEIQKEVNDTLKAALILGFNELREANSEQNYRTLLATHGLSSIPVRCDMEIPIRAVRISIAAFAEKTVEDRTEKLSELRNSIPEAVASEVLRESTIDSIIAKINSKQLLHSKEAR